MKKHGFTLIELLIVICILGILATIVAFRYHGAQLRARTAENVKRSHDVINVAEQQLALALTSKDRTYPNKSDQAIWDQFLERVPAGSSRNLVTQNSDGPNRARPENLLYVMCTEDGSSSRIVGIIVHYWNYVDDRVDQLTSGHTSDPGLICY